MASKTKTASFSVPSAIWQQYMSDPRLLMAQALQQQGGSMAPVQSNMEGIARALQGVIGGYQAGQIRNEYQAKGDQYNNDLSGALNTAQTGVPAWTNPDTGQQAIPAVAPGSDALIAGLSSARSPEVKEMGANAMIAKMLQKPEKPNLPTGYEIDPTTGQARLIPGVDPSYGKRADPFMMPIAGIDPQTGQPKFGTKQDAVNGGIVPPPANAPAPKEFELQSKGYADRMIESGRIAGQLERDGLNPANTKENAINAVPGVGNFFTTPEFQSYRQAADDWIRAKLRKESGASIPESEMAREYKTYFPVPGDSPEVIKQKANSRKLAEQGMITNAGAAWSTQPAAPVEPVKTPESTEDTAEYTEDEIFTAKKYGLTPAQVREQIKAHQGKK